MGLSSRNARISGKAVLSGRPLLPITPSALRHRLGNEIAIIFQDPFSAFHPHRKLGAQMCEVLIEKKGMLKMQARSLCKLMLDAVKMPSAEESMNRYPHELSGGMQQRALIASALLCRPKLLVADEATTALDVTIQAAILKLLKELQKEFSMSIAMITHDLGVVAEIADRVMVMYRGRVVEQTDSQRLFKDPLHPYTAALLSSLPSLEKVAARLTCSYEICKDAPVFEESGCVFFQRCSLRRKECQKLVMNLSPLKRYDTACPYFKSPKV